MKRVTFTWFGKGEDLVHELHMAVVTDGNGHGIWVYFKANKGNCWAVYLLLFLMGDAELVPKE